MKLDVLAGRSDDYNVSMRLVTVLSKKVVSAPLRVLISFGQHGREIVTSEVALELLQVLAGERPLPTVREISALAHSRI